MIILGIDLGIANTGYGLVEVNHGKFQLLDFGNIKTESKTKSPHRLKKIYDEVIHLVEQYQPEFLVLEAVFFSKNVSSALAVGEAKGITKLAAANTDREVKVALPSPYLLGQRMWHPDLSRKAYPSRRDFTEALVPVLRQELVALRDEGVAIAQFDDPQLCLFVDPKVRATYDDPEAEVGYCVDMLNRIVDGVDGIRTALHLCRRNKGRLGWVGEGGYEPILSALGELDVDMLMLEFAIPAAGDVKVLRELPERFEIGLGCVDCRSSHIDEPGEIVARVKRALEHVSPERITLHPDCGFAPGSSADIPIDEAYRKIRNLSLAAKILRDKYG